MHGATPEGMVNPIWLLVGAVFVFAVLTGSIRRGNRRQRPVLWVAAITAIAMILFPPWLGEVGQWVNAAAEPGQYESRYVTETVSTGYALVGFPPKPGPSATAKPMSINWTRLGIQLAITAALATVLTWRLKLEPIPEPPEDPASA